MCEQERRDKTTSYLVGSLWEVWSLVAVGAVVHTAHYDAPGTNESPHQRAGSTLCRFTGVKSCVQCARTIRCSVDQPRDVAGLRVARSAMRLT